MMQKKDFFKQELFEMERVREKIDAICARHKCEHFADLFEAICRNTSVLLVCLSREEDDRGKDLLQMVLSSLALDLQLIEKCTSRQVAEAFSECFNEASASVDATFKRAEK